MYQHSWSVVLFAMDAPATRWTRATAGRQFEGGQQVKASAGGRGHCDHNEGEHQTGMQFKLL